MKIIIFGLLLLLTACGIKKHAKPCKQCPQFAYNNYEALKTI